ncbi:MAG: PQQ-like beta-propeller repeat protein, partial [Planctomycetaceae bacterium]|nr:PQQ-like beta-propeller repeat protein [Planctomycetaceae bacterium]
MHVPGWFGRILFRLSRPHTVFIWLILPGWMSLHILFTSPGLLADPGPPQDRLHPPPGNIEESPPDQTSPELFQQRQALLPLLYRDRQQEAVYHEIRRAFETGRTIEALQLLQRLFDAEEDSFYWPSTTSAPISIRSAARDLFFSQTPGEWELYEQLNSAAASSLLAEAQDQKALSLYRELVRRFPFTSAGLQARRYLVYHAIDRHKFHEAHHHLHELITSEIHSQRILDSDHHLYHFLKYQIQPDSWNQHLSNDYELRTAMIERTSGRSYPILQVSRSELDENYFSAATHNRNQTVWREVTPPYLNKVWSASHMESSDSLLHQTMQYWEEEQQSELKPSAVGWKPVVVNETVYVRNYNDITAFNLHSGEMLWRYPCQSQFSPLLENFRPHGRMQSRSQFSQLTSELNLDELLVGNNLLGTITHDAKRLYLIDEVELKSLKAPIPAGVIAHTDNVFDESQARRRSNRLIALPLHQSEKLHSLPQKPSWTVGGVFDQKNTRQNNPLSGHFILGPPLVDGEVLYLLSEHEQQINLIALNAESGHVLWKQGIGWVEFMIDQDIYRSHRAATPVLAHNLLLCPCQTGMLVAIDRSSGSLRWVYDYRELNEIQQHRHWSRRRNSQRGHLGFDDHPVVQGNKVLYLPHQSESLHCLDLNTGKVLWKKLRKDADYIGAVDHNLAFIVGRKSCRGLTLRNGVEVWSNRLGTPSGRGIRAGHVYLLPLQSGQIASINIQTGEYAGLSHLHQRVTSDLTGTTDISPTSPEVKQIGSWSPGNLIASQNYVISAGPRGITVFPQAGSEIYQNPIPGDRAIELASGTGQLQDNSATSAHLRQAELNLILDRLEEAQQHLEHCLAVKDALILDERFQVEQLLKEVLYARMRTEPAQRDRHFQQLKSFASSNAEQGRLLMEEAEFQLMNGNHQASWQNVVAVAEFDLNLPLTDTTDSTLTITPRSWIPLMRERLLSTGGNTFLHLFELQTERCLDEALNSEDKHRLEIFLTLFGDGEPAAIAQMKLANRYLDEGQFHRAEQLWLNVREMSYPRLATLASQNLVSLWTRFGLYQLAANEIEQQSAGNLILSMQATSDNMLQLCLSQIQKKNENVLRVRIDEERWSEEGAELAGYRIALNPQSTSDFTLITKGSGHTGKLSLLDRQSGTILDDIDVPTGSLSNQLYRNQVCGSQLCLGGD